MGCQSPGWLVVLTCKGSWRRSDNYIGALGAAVLANALAKNTGA